MIKIKTNLGDITCQLHEDKVPNTTKNFLHYVGDKHYEGVIFHRVIDGFMIQTGGMREDMSQKDTTASIENEADKGAKNKRGTLAMARTSDPHSASAQFFINTKDNDFLNFKSKDMSGWGYCVFGEVVEGMEVVDKISKVKTTNKMGHGDVPVESVLIHSIELV